MGSSLPNSGGPLRLCHTSAQTSSLSIFKRYSQICHTSFLCKRVVSDGTFSNLLMSFSWDMRFWDFSCCICMPTTRIYMDHYGSICFHWVSHCQACRSHSSGAHAACLGPSLMRRSVSLAERLFWWTWTYWSYCCILIILRLRLWSCHVLSQFRLADPSSACLRLLTTLGLWMQSSQRPICGGAVKHQWCDTETIPGSCFSFTMLYRYSHTT